MFHGTPVNMITGIVSGLLVTLLVVVFRAAWRQIVIPWFEERVYKDAHIEGNWFSLYPAPEDPRQETITLKRHGHAVTGVITCISGADKGEVYTVTGSFRNMILPLVYESSDTQKTDRGTITLKLLANAQKFEGKVSSYDNTGDTIFDMDVTWFRSQTQLDAALVLLDKETDSINQRLQLEAARVHEPKKQRTRVPRAGRTDTVQPELHPSSDGDIDESPETPLAPAIGPTTATSSAEAPTSASI